jgi:hypothetical protein
MKPASHFDHHVDPTDIHTTEKHSFDFQRMPQARNWVRRTLIALAYIHTSTLYP